MTKMELIEVLLKAVLIPVIPVITLYVSLLVKRKADLITAELEKSDKEYLHKYVDLAEDAILKGIVAVNQTYVELLKNGGAFTKENQVEAFSRAKDMVNNILTEDVKLALDLLYGDYNTYINITIEEMVNYAKNNNLLIE